MADISTAPTTRATWPTCGRESALPATPSRYRRSQRCSATPTRGGKGFWLSSGGLFSAHADFINAWDPKALREVVDRCLNRYIHKVCRPPTLQLQSLQPLTTGASNFVPRERVTLTLNEQHTQRVGANANAAFVSTFRDATINPCGYSSTSRRSAATEPWPSTVRARRRARPRVPAKDTEAASDSATRRGCRAYVC